MVAALRLLAPLLALTLPLAAPAAALDAKRVFQNARQSVVLVMDPGGDDIRHGGLEEFARKGEGREE